MADEGGNVVRPLGGGHVRCPLFRCGFAMDDRRNTYRFLARVLGNILFEKRAAKNKIEVLNGEVTAWLPFFTRVFHSLGTSREATVRFVCSKIWLFNLETNSFLPLFCFSLLLFCSAAFVLVFFSFSGEFSSFLFLFPIWVFFRQRWITLLEISS